MKNVIYKIRNITNGKFYVGSTCDSRERFRNHRKMLRGNRHHCKHLQASWNKYGEDFFKFEIIEELDNSDLLFEVENLWLQGWVGKKECYNSGRSAEAPMRGIATKDHPNYGRVWSSEEKQKVSNSLKEYYANSISHRLGVPHTQETLGKIAQNRTPPKGVDHYGYGLTRSAETKAKISEKCKGLVNPMKGKTHSEQSKANMSAAVKRGEESHFYGKRPVNADDLQKEIYAVLPDRTIQTFVSLTHMRDTLGVSIAAIIRACKSGNPIKFGVLAGWVLSYVGKEINEAPEIPEEYMSFPRTRQDAKDKGEKQYYTGVPCERGHLSPRKTKGTCIACMKADYKKDNDRRKANKLIDITPK